MHVDQAFMLSALLFGSNISHVWCLRHTLTSNARIGYDIKYGSAGSCQHEHLTPHTVREKTPLTWSSQTHECRSYPHRPLCGELSKGFRTTGRLKVRVKDVCKKDLKQYHIDVWKWWETQANDRSAWWSVVMHGTQNSEETRKTTATRKKYREKRCKQQHRQSTPFVCARCGRSCLHKSACTVIKKGQMIRDRRMLTTIKFLLPYFRCNFLKVNQKILKYNHKYVHYKNLLL